MEELKLALTGIFDEMILQVKAFRRKTYDGIFTECHNKHKQTMHAIENLCKEAAEEEREVLLDQIAAVIPLHAQEAMQKLPKRQKERDAVDYNMNMAVYIVPLLTYEHQEYCEQIADQMVAKWNEMDITGLTLMRSKYEDIAGGFKKGLCFITTAICESRSQPDDCYELTTLRSYRDSYLLHTEDGKALVEEYYEIAPGLVRIIDMQKDVKQVYEGLYEKWLMPCIRHIESGEADVCKALYVDMVQELKNTYLYS